MDLPDRSPDAVGRHRPCFTSLGRAFSAASRSGPFGRANPCYAYEPSGYDRENRRAVPDELTQLMCLWVNLDYSGSVRRSFAFEGERHGVAVEGDQIEVLRLDAEERV